eukprot:COSAG01_NODE_63360_length_283_cov_0.850829_1_plen_76_part_10
MSVTRWDVTPRNASLGPCATVQWICFWDDGGTHAPRDERGIAAASAELPNAFGKAAAAAGSTVLAAALSVLPALDQ